MEEYFKFMLGDGDVWGIHKTTLEDAENRAYCWNYNRTNEHTKITPIKIDESEFTMLYNEIKNVNRDFVGFNVKGSGL